MAGMAVREVMRTGKARTLTYCFLALVVAVSLGMLASTKPAHAKTFTVNSTRDDPAVGSTANGVCDTGFTFTEEPLTGQKECTLRAAIQEANATTGADTIAFGIPTTDQLCGGSTMVCFFLPGSDLPTITRPLT